MKGMVPVFDAETKKSVNITIEEFQNNREKYLSFSKGFVTAKGEDGKAKRVSVCDADYKNGNLVPLWKGRKHSVFAKEKMSKTHKENGDQIGEKNSQYGTCWITKFNENKKIKTEELDKYISNGWKRGRHFADNAVKTKFSEDKVNEVLLLSKNGKSQKKISEMLKMSKSSVYRIIKKYGE